MAAWSSGFRARADFPSTRLQLTRPDCAFAGENLTTVQGGERDGDRSDHHSHTIAAGCIPYMALQQKLGLLSERLAWIDPRDCDHTDSGWPHLTRTSLKPMRVPSVRAL